MEGFADESGLFGVAGHRQAAWWTYLGLHALQHRGSTGAGIACSDGHLVRARFGRGPVQAIFAEPGVQDLVGGLAVGQVFGGAPTADDRPVTARYRGGQVALAMSGRFANGSRLRRDLKEHGALFTTLTDAELLLHLLAGSPQRTVVNRLVDALWKVEGAFSLLLATEDRMIAVRDPRGFRPLLLGRHEGATLFSTEDGAIRLVGGEVEREVAPGEMVIVDADGARSVTPFAPRGHARCAHEFVGLARADATVFGQPAHGVRAALGQRLAKEQPCSSGQVVVSLPEEGAHAALGYARAARIPYQEGLIGADITGRRFVEPAAEVKDFGARLRLIPVPGVLSGSRVVLVVAAVGTGAEVRKAVRILRDAGAVEVHLRAAAPLVRAACPYGVASPTDEELVGTRHAAPAELVEWLGADSVGFLSVEALREAAGGPGLCDGCFTGNWPVPIAEPEDQLPLFGE